MFSDAADENEKVFYEGSIDPKWITRRMIDAIAGSGCCSLCIFIPLIIITFLPVGLSFFGSNIMMFAILAIVGVILLCIISEYFVGQAHVRNFSYQITGTHIIIQRGVFSKRRDSIPFSRIQNISVTSGFFDRMFGLSNVQIETAGGSGMVYPMGKRGRAAMSAEGFIPGQTNPQFIESKIREMVKKHDSGGGGT
jgi:membrane protein YdbS with pleckstrin-like domain